MPEQPTFDPRENDPLSGYENQSYPGQPPVEQPPYTGFSGEYETQPPITSQADIPPTFYDPNNSAVAGNQQQWEAREGGYAQNPQEYYPGAAPSQSSYANSEQDSAPYSGGWAPQEPYRGAAAAQPAYANVDPTQTMYSGPQNEPYPGAPGYTPQYAAPDPSMADPYGNAQRASYPGAPISPDASGGIPPQQNYGWNDPQTAAPSPDSNNAGTSGLGIASLVIGIIAIATSFMPIVNNGSFFLGLLGLVLAIIGIVTINRGNASGRGIAIAGLILSVAACIIVLITQTIYVNAINDITETVTSNISSSDSSSSSSTDMKSDDSAKTEDKNESSTQTTPPSANGENNAHSKADSAESTAPPAAPTVPREYQSALASAKNYLSFMPFSYQGLYDQLTSEYADQFSPEAARYAVDNCGADWNQEALEAAINYQNMMNMSPAAIYDQLVSEYGEQFTPEQAQYAIDHLPQ